MDFTPTASDPFIFVNDTDIIILYVDDCIIISKSKEEAGAIFEKLTSKEFKMTDERKTEEYIGILITHNDDGSLRMSQPHLIDRILYSVPGMNDARSVTTLASAGIILTKDTNSETRKEH